MKTKILYVIVSNENDIYIEQLYCSVYSAKNVMPDCHIALLMDKATEQSLKGYRSKVLDYVDEVVSVPLDTNRYNGQKQSRLLKTNARNYIDGDFLFIDCDTLIVKSLNSIDQCPYTLAACWDTHSRFSQNPFRETGAILQGKVFEWPLEEEEEYFNSGVIYVKDLPETREFYKQWYNNLLLGHIKGVTMDQPAFAYTNYQLNHPIKRLDDTWNCELKYGMKYLRDAKIIHYLCTNRAKANDQQLFPLNDYNILYQIKTTGEIPDIVKKTINDPYYGLASVSKCLAGRDILWEQSTAATILRNLYDTNYYNLATFLLRVFNKILKVTGAYRS